MNQSYQVDLGETMESSSPYQGSARTSAVYGVDLNILIIAQSVLLYMINIVSTP